MRIQKLLVCSVFLFVAATAQAKGGGNIMRGGLGFLFPDHNSFANPGQFAAARGMAIEAMYQRTNQASGPQMLMPSFVYGNGGFGLGFYGARAGMGSLSGTDQVGAGLGLSLMKGRITVGFGYDKTLGAGSDSGDFSATLTFNPGNRRGTGLGVGYKHGLSSGAQELKAGLGFSFSSNNNIELDVTFPSVSSFSNFDLGALFTMYKKYFFLGGGYVMAKTATTQHGAAARLGFVLGSSFDFSLTGSHYFGAGNPVAYGGSLRASF